MLEPSDFGVASMCMVVIVFLQAIKDGGFSQIIIQAADERVADMVFSIQLALSCVAVAILWIAAPWISGFFDDVTIILPLRIMALSLLVSPFVDIPLLLCQRQLDFKATFIRSLVAPLIAGTVAITMALNGYGYWALIVGTLTSQVVAAAILPILSGWKPRIDFSWRERTGELKFGLHMLYQGILRWANNQVAKLSLGKAQGAGQLGFYEVAQQLASMPYNCIAGALQKLAFPLLAQKHRASEEVGTVFLTMVQRLALVSIPMGVAAACVSKPLIHLVVGDKWLPMHPLFLACLVVANTAAFVQLNNAALKATNQPHVLSWFLSFRSLIAIPIYIYAGSQGIGYLAVAVAVLALVLSPINTFHTCRALKMRFSKYLVSIGKASFIPAVSILIATYLVYLVGFTDGVKIIAVSLAAFASIGVNMYFVDRPLLLQVVAKIK